MSLQEAGLPLSVCIQLQECKLSLCSLDHKTDEFWFLCEPILARAAWHAERCNSVREEKNSESTTEFLPILYRRDLVDIHYFPPIVYRKKIVEVPLNPSHIIWERNSGYPLIPSYIIWERNSGCITLFLLYYIWEKKSGNTSWNVVFMTSPSQEQPCHPMKDVPCHVKAELGVKVVHYWNYG